jgi:protoporphyrinogen oxidase
MKKAVIIGAGPAGLAAGHRLINSGVDTVILERDAQVGGLSRTFEYKGCRFDLGSHRFFTKNKEVFAWWQDLLGDDFKLTRRHTRIYYNGVFFNYPLSISNVLAKLGPVNSLPIFFSYLKSRAFPHAQEHNFEKWVTNRFGKKLYQIFFKEYTEKVWGIPCDRISSDWAAQRIKGLSLSSALRSALFPRRSSDIKTLIHEFYYPRLGAGMMYERARERISGGRARLICGARVNRLHHRAGKIEWVEYKSSADGQKARIDADVVCSSMPLPDLIKGLDPQPPSFVIAAAEKLHFRSLVMVYLLVDCAELFPDNWIYVNSNDVAVGRICNYKNWSPDMVPDKSTTTLGLEYFCTEGDPVWRSADQDLIALAQKELAKLRFAPRLNIKDAFVLRVPGAYPVYENGYAPALAIVKDYAAGFKNLYCMGRAGMFRYNNMDHSILTGLLCAKNILGADEDIWSVNVDKAYHEELEGN